MTRWRRLVAFIGVVAFVTVAACGQSSAFASPTIYAYDAAAQHSSTTTEDHGVYGTAIRASLLAEDMSSDNPARPARDFVAADTAPKAIAAGDRVAPWAGTSLSRVTQTDESMYRVWGGDSGQAGEWRTPIEPTSSAAARQGLALPGGNSAEYVSRVTVPAGTRIQVGTAGGAFGQPGGWTQVQLLQRIPSSNFGKGVPLGP